MKRPRLSPRHELDLDRADRRLLAVVDGALEEAVRRAVRGDSSSWLACRPGCTECCHGPFPINELDARRLRQGLTELAGRDPQRAEAVAGRARTQLALLRQGYPGDPETGGLHDDGEAAEAWFSRHGGLPCPVLDPETGRCDLYSHRPITCRSFGPPVQIGESPLPPCRLCFQGASGEVVEACRVEPDPHGLEDRLLARLGNGGNPEPPDTLIAFALGG
ncbi:MAG TPA: YkgJ family cysteine cluster protein [Thermoanaerobaculia bacterium]|nr:YkgJ family cysteine cluster protein [Thermoanaerobaculia bacterium]